MFRRTKGILTLKDEKHLSEYSIGDFSYGPPGSPNVLRWHKNEQLTIGKFCSFASNVTILLGGEHRTDWITTYPFNVLFNEFSNFKEHPKSKGNVKIGNDVWVGMNVIILSGVTVGDGAVIGAGAVVSKDVPPYAIVAGNPAKIVKTRFSPTEISRLLEIKWWDWDFELIKKNMHLLLSNDIKAFLNSV
jgi:acetyltransferase-like isoleucine patch superfamily enzyme